MRYSTVLGLAGLANAHLPGVVGDVLSPVLSPVTSAVPIAGGIAGSILPAVCPMTESWDNKVLFSGIVGAATETHAAVSLDLALSQAQVKGEISLAPLDNFLLEPCVRLNLAKFQAYVAVDLSASAAVFQTVTLIASPALDIDLGLLEIDLGAAFALDLVVSAGAAVDLSAGFFVTFSEGDYIDLSLITKQVKGSFLAGLGVKALPLTIGAGVDLSTDIDVLLGLRLRSHISVGAEVELAGLDLLDVGADIAIWADLVQHKITIGQSKGCAVSAGHEFGLSVGIAVEAGVEVADILDISLAPSVYVTLARADKNIVCMADRGNNGKVDPTSALQSPGSPSTGVVTTPSTPTPTATGSGMITTTISSTTTYTVTSCLASVPNCPASQTQVIVTSAVKTTVTVCPATQTAFPTTTPASPARPVPTITETLTSVVPCKPTSSTFTPPPGTAAPAPTVTISDTVTVCPTGSSSLHPIPSGSPSVSIPASTDVHTTGSAAPSAPVSQVPTGGSPSGPVHSPGAPWPSSNNTWTSVYTPPGSTWVPPTTALPTTTGANSPVKPSVTPSGIPSSAESLKAGVAVIIPAVLVMLF